MLLCRCGVGFLAGVLSMRGIRDIGTVTRASSKMEQLTAAKALIQKLEKQAVISDYEREKLEAMDEEVLMKHTDQPDEQRVLYDLQYRAENLCNKRFVEHTRNSPMLDYEHGHKPHRSVLAADALHSQVLQQQAAPEWASSLETQPGDLSVLVIASAGRQEMGHQGSSRASLEADSGSSGQIRSYMCQAGSSHVAAPRLVVCLLLIKIYSPSS
ncbi:unnamed protein product [Symbiodinium sp. CCMP2456]|nr:unnamed protein product [Symbiodinium sp. CCMP2456]